MSALSVPAIILAAGLTITPSLYAQAQAPDITLPPGDAVRGKAIFEGSKGNCQSCHRVNGVGSLFGPDLSTIGAPPARGGGGRAGGGGAGGGNAARGAAPAATPAGAPATGTANGAARGPVPAFGGDEVANAAIARGAAPARGAGNAPSGPTPQQFAQSIQDPNAVVAPTNRYVVLKMKDGKTITGKLLSVDTFAYQIFDSTEKLANISKDSVREATMASPMPSYKDKLSTQELSDVISYLMSLKGQ
jgi:mono/diheme cytochrome c family protein